MKTQSIQPVLRIEPPCWWINMRDPKLQILIYGTEISSYKINIEHEYVFLTNVHLVSNPNYLFLEILISKNIKACSFNLQFSKGKEYFIYSYPLYLRNPNSSNKVGFDSSDAIYLIMPDRFSKGNSIKNGITEMMEAEDRTNPDGRHGGNIKGVFDHLNYIQELGFTSIWLNPVLENNQQKTSYHGYAITDFYKVDARLGTNLEFKELCEECNSRGIKMIMDMVFNHCGSFHWWMQDLPSENWINQWETFTPSNYRLSTISDPYVSQYDKDKSVKGWFDTSMPDLNLENQFLLQYMIQNSIWWIEYAQLSGIRMDTYPYPDKHCMAEWVQRIMKEYPNFNIVGEAWITEPSKLCYWQKDFKNKDGYNSLLPSLMDFPMQTAISQAFNEEETWHTGLIKLYNTLADDHLYTNPMNLVVFPDNHDEGRILHQLNNDIRRLKMALAYASTIRGILQIYYGTELLMNGNGVNGHGNIREDFPGGWPDDTTNAFQKDGRTKLQNHIYNYIQTLLLFRKNSSALKYGKTIHFLPEDGIYVYFRFSDTQTIMIILNNNFKERKILKTKRFNEVLYRFSQGINIVTKQIIYNLDPIVINAKSAIILELLT